MGTIITRNWRLTLSLIFFAPSLAYAHTGIGHTIGFSHGFTHPFGGLDHILAMVAVGIWAAQVGGKATWVVPSTFVSVMVIGGIVGIAGITLPFVEPGIVLSVLILGVLITAAARLPLAASAAIVGLFALFHGHAHGTEIPTAVSGFGYGIGFALATAFLHLSGIGIGIMFKNESRMLLVRSAGAMITVGGLYLLLN